MSRAYGGKLGVWLTKKNATAPSCPFDVSSSPLPSQSQKQQQHESKVGIQRKCYSHTTRRTFSTCSSRARKTILAGGSFLPSTIMNKIHDVQRKLSSSKLSSGRNQQGGMIGWDDVQCRPVYYNTQPFIEEQDFDQSDIENSNSVNDSSTKNDNPISKEKKLLTKKDNETNSRTDSDTLSGSEHDLSPEHRTGMKEKSLFIEIKKVNNKPKHSYGNLTKQKKRRLVDMATSVWEQCVSPARKFCSYQHGTLKGKRRKGKKSASLGKYPCGTVKNPMEFALMDFTLKSEDDTPPPPNNFVVCFDSNRRDTNDELDNECQKIAEQKKNENEIRSKQKENLNMPTFDDVKSYALEGENEEFRPEIRLKPKKFKIRVKERKDSADLVVGGNATVQESRDSSVMMMSHDDKDRGAAPSQPTSFTALADAKAFFDYLDTTHELKIE